MRESRNLLDILNLAHARTPLVSCVAWLLDPAGEHGLGERALQALAQALAREAVHGGALADREGVLAASRRLRQADAPPPRADVYVDEDGPHVRLQADDLTLRLQPCLDEPPPGAEVVEALRRRKVVLLCLTPGAPPGPAHLERPAAAVWPLGELVGALREVTPTDAYGHFLAQLREHLEPQLAWTPPRAARPDAPAAAAPAPGATAPVTPATPTPAAPPPAAPPRPQATPEVATPAPAAAGGDDPTESTWDAGWGSGGHGGDDDWMMNIITGEAPPPAAATTPTPPAPAAPRAPAPRCSAPIAHEGHVDLDRADQVEGARAVREVLGALQKAIHFFRLYPQEHPLCGQTVEETVRGVRELLARHGALEVQIQRDGVAFRGERIIEEQGRATDFSFLLYPEGIRSLTFDHGIEPREVHQFVETLSGQDPALTAEHDLLGALWRREFAHIQYLTHDQLSPAALRVHHDSTLAPVARRIATVTPALHRSTPDSDAALERLLRAEPALDADDPALLATRPERAADYRETPAGEPRQRLIEQVFDPFMGDLLGRAADVVAWSSSSEELEPDPVDVAHFMAGSVINVLWQGDVPRAADLLGRAEAGGDLHPELVARLTGRDALSLVVRALRPSESAPPPSEEAGQAAVRYLAHLGPRAVAPVARTWGRLVDADVRKIVHSYLAAQVTSQPEALVPLTEHSEAQVASDAMDMFVQAARHPRIKELLERLAADPTTPARQARAREALDALSGEGERKRLLQALEAGQERDERVAAARQLAGLGNLHTFERLCALAQQKDFAQRDDEELDAVLGALTRLGGVRSVRLLQELSERRSLLARRDTQRLSTAASTWLAELKKTRRAP